MLVLAWRNIWRQRSRSLAAIFAVGFVVWLGLVYFGMVGAARDGFAANLSENAGQLQVHTRDYRDARDIRDSVIHSAAAVRARIEATLSDMDVAAALDVPVLLAGADRSRGVLLVGMDQPRALRDRVTAAYLAEGRLPAAGELDGIALGGGLARALQVKVGDTVYAYAPGTEGTGAAAYTVVGVLKFPDPARDANIGFLSLSAAQDLAAPEAVSRFELHSGRRALADVVLVQMRDRLQSTLGGSVLVETWREAFPALSRIEQVMRPVVLVFIGLFFVLAGLLVVNTIYLSVIERTREFGIVIALGARRGRVMRMVIAESLALCGTGAALGLVLGLLTLARLAQGFSYPGLEEVTAQFGIPSVLYARIEPAEIAAVLIFALATGVLAALMPARSAGRLEPIDAMRFVA